MLENSSNICCLSICKLACICAYRFKGVWICSGAVLAVLFKDLQVIGFQVAQICVPLSSLRLNSKLSSAFFVCDKKNPLNSVCIIRHFIFDFAYIYLNSKLAYNVHDIAHDNRWTVAYRFAQPICTGDCWKPIGVKLKPAHGENINRDHIQARVAPKEKERREPNVR